jgi:hypothetical protein
VVARGALAWTVVRNAGRVVWNALNSAWVPPHAFGGLTNPSEGLNGVAGTVDDRPSTPPLEWAPLWRCAWTVLDLLDSVGRHKIEQYFGQGVPQGVFADMYVRGGVG